MKKFGRAGSTFGTVIAAAVVLAIATTGGAVAGGLVTSAKIKNNTIKSIDVKNGNLTGVDVADGSLGGADIADGGIGKADVAAAAQGYTSIVTKRFSQPINDTQTLTANVACPAGAVAIGGGAYVVPTGVVLVGSSAGTLVRSHPSTPGGGLTFSFPAGDNESPTAWRTTVNNGTGADSTAVHYAICASK